MRITTDPHEHALAEKIFRIYLAANPGMEMAEERTELAAIIAGPLQDLCLKEGPRSRRARLKAMTQCPSCQATLSQKGTRTPHNRSRISCLGSTWVSRRARGWREEFRVSFAWQRCLSVCVAAMLRVGCALSG
eukprot:3933446-Rhodomonas_salina.7